MLQVFKNEKYGDIRVHDVNGEPYFMAADVCKVLGHSNTTVALNRLDKRDKAKFNLALKGSTPSFVNESGLYDLILSSRKKEAIQFKRWITAEVVPSIRKHGAYVQPDKLEEMLADPDTMIRTLEALKEEREGRIAAENKVKGLEGTLEKARPAVVFTKAVTASDDCILLGQLAKLIKQNGVDIGEKRFFQWLRENGYLCHSDGNRNVPTQQAMNMGLFKVKEYLYQTAHGKEVMNRTTLATGKGQVYFINKLLRA